LTGEKIVKAVIYARFSSHNQREESIEGQLRECKDFAQRNQIEVIGSYIDRAMSAKTDNRPEFQRMIRDSYVRQFDVVIVYELDRFARNRYDSAIYKSKLKKNGVRVMSAKENITDDPTGIILESMLEGMAEYYSAELAQKIDRGMHENVLESKGVGGNLALGYRMTADNKFEIDPVGAEVVRKIFKMYGGGSSIKEIVTELNAQGAKTALGKSFKSNSLSRILRNQKYIGVYKYKDVVAPNGIPPIIDFDLFYKVQDCLKKNQKAPARKKAKEEYLLTGKIFCGKCKGNIVGECGRSRNGETYYYYKCANHKHSQGCKAPAVRKDWIETAVVEETVKKVLTEEMIEVISNNAVELQKKEQSEGVIKELKQKLKEKEKAISNLIKAVEAGMFSPSIRARISSLEDEKACLEGEIAKEQIEKPFITSNQVKFYLEHFRNGNTNDTKYCRDIIDIFVRAVYIFDDKYYITYYYTNDSRFKCAPNGSDLECYGSP
jgi:DNA invertase Pin-like site-specific DNA recombinase